MMIFSNIFASHCQTSLSKFAINTKVLFTALQSARTIAKRFLLWSRLYWSKAFRNNLIISNFFFLWFKTDKTNDISLSIQNNGSYNRNVCLCAFTHTKSETSRDLIYPAKVTFVTCNICLNFKSWWRLGT